MSVDLICVVLNIVIYPSTTAAISRVNDIQLPLFVGPLDFRLKVLLFKENEVVCAIGYCVSDARLLACIMVTCFLNQEAHEVNDKHWETYRLNYILSINVTI